MAELEKQTILSTGIGKTTLYRKLKEYVAQD